MNACPYPPPVASPPKSADLLAQFNRYLEAHCGMRINPTRQGCLKQRLESRAHQFGLKDPREYLDILSRRRLFAELGTLLAHRDDSPEHLLQRFNALTFLMEKVMPQLVKLYGSGTVRPFRLCLCGAPGEEDPLLFSRLLYAFASRYERFDFQVISLVYGMEEDPAVRQAPQEADEHSGLLRRWLSERFPLQGGEARAAEPTAEELRATIDYRVLDLGQRHLGIREPLDAVFCFSDPALLAPESRDRLLCGLAGLLFPGRFMFLCPSATPPPEGTRLTEAAPRIYLKGTPTVRSPLHRRHRPNSMENGLA